MTILLKPSLFSSFTAPKLIFRVVSQKIHQRLVWRRGPGLYFILLPVFCIIDEGSAIYL